MTNTVREIAILMPCWKNAALLEISIPSLLKATKSNSEIIVILNEADEESKSVLNRYKIKTIELDQNDGPAAVDFAIPYIKEKNFRYVANVNSDMIFSEGWDHQLIELLEKNSPCTVSCTLVEPVKGICTLYDNLGDFFGEGNHERFNENVKKGKYKTRIATSYCHPILCRSEDFLAVNGYSNGMKKKWVDLKGRGLDDDFAYRLYRLHGGRFKFLRSDRAFVYHGISINSAQLTTDQRRPGHQAFLEENGLSIIAFNKMIGHELHSLKTRIKKLKKLPLKLYKIIKKKYS